jgi:hypothetical protein
LHWRDHARSVSKIHLASILPSKHPDEIVHPYNCKILLPICFQEKQVIPFQPSIHLLESIPPTLDLRFTIPASISDN